MFVGDDTFAGGPRPTIVICEDIRDRGIDIPWDEPSVGAVQTWSGAC